MKKIFLLLIYFIPLLLLSQIGPGGVNTNLVYWFKADAGTSTVINGAALDTWFDQSGNGNNATAVGALRPTYILSTPAINNMPSLSYNGNNQLDMIYSGNSNENMSFGSVFLTNTPNGEADIIIQHGGRNTLGVCGATAVGGYNANAFMDFIGATVHNSTTLATANTWYIYQKTISNTGGSPTANGIRYYKNETADGIFSNPVENRTSTTHIGGNGPGGQTDLNGSIAETYKFGKTLNDAERLIVANYLSSKYNLAINGASDRYAGDTGVNGDFDFEVIGVGNETAGIITGSHILAQNSGGLTLQSNTNFNDGDYLLAGHKNQPNFVNTTDISGVAGLQGRWERIWYFDKTDAGAAMTVNITFDFSNIGLGPSIVPSINTNYKLLYRATNSGAWTDAGTATSIAGDQVIFSANSLSNGDGYYTLGSLDIWLSPLPIELISFSANQKDRSILLNWQTASEKDNDYFSVEKLNLENEWVEIARVQGAGNSSSILSYEEIDNSPYIGLNYYRLRQTDLDGNSTLSETESVLFENGETVLVYPNPAEDFLIVENKDLKDYDIRIIDFSGRNLSEKISVSADDLNRFVVNISNLSCGMYYLYVGDLMFKINKR